MDKNGIDNLLRDGIEWAAGIPVDTSLLSRIRERPEEGRGVLSALGWLVQKQKITLRDIVLFEMALYAGLWMDDLERLEDERAFYYLDAFKAPLQLWGGHPVSDEVGAMTLKLFWLGPRKDLLSYVKQQFEAREGEHKNVKVMKARRRANHKAAYEAYRRAQVRASVMEKYLSQPQQIVLAEFREFASSLDLNDPPRRFKARARKSTPPII